MRISAVILAGGKGERLFPLTNTRPKPLCPVGGVYPLERAIELAREAGAGEIIVTAGYMASSIEAYTRGMENVTTLREEKPLSTAGAVRNARPSGDIIIVLCGDTLCGFSLLPAVKAQMNGDCDATIVTTRSKAPTEYGIVTVTDGRVTGFLEKPSWNGVTGDEVNTGIYILRRRVLELIPPETPYDFGGELFPNMVADGKPVAVFRADGYWCDMGSPKTYFLANMLATGGENAADGSAVIHEKARVRHSVIMSDVYIGRNSEIEGSIICENVKIGRGCHIGAVVIIIPVLFRPLCGVYQCRVHSVIGIVKADIPCARPMFGLLVEIDAEIQPVTGRQPVVIPVRNIAGMFDASVGFQDNGLLFGYGGGPATAEYP